MNWFYNLSIRMKLLAAFSVIFLIVGGLSIFSAVKMQAINAASTEIVTNWLPSARYLANMRHDLLFLRHAESQHRHAISAEQRQRLEQDVAAAQASLLENQHRYELLISSQQERQLYQDFIRWQKEHLFNWATSVSGQNNDGGLDDASSQSFKKAEALLEALIQLNVEGAQRVRTQADRDYAQSLILLSGTVLMSILLIGLLSLLVNYRIGRPIQRLARMADKISQGDYGVRTQLDYDTDELGELAQAFDKMIASLQRHKQGAERALDDLSESESEQNLQLFANMGHDAIWELDLITEDLVWSERFATMLGYRPDEIEPGMAFWNSHVHPDDKERVAASFNSLVASGGRHWSEEYRFCRSDGSYAYLLDRGYVVHDAAGKPARMIGTLVDMTERKQVELALSSKYDQLQAIYHLTDAVNQANTAEDLYQKAINALHYTLHVDRASILLLDEQGVMRFVAWRGLSAPYREAVEGNSLWGSADDSLTQPILIDDTGQEPRLEALRATLHKEGVCALAFIPIRHQKQLLGRFVVYYDLPHVFSDTEMQLFQTIANHIAFAIWRVRQIAKLEHQALHDSLCDIPNRTLFHAHLVQAIAVGQRAGTSLALLLIDLNHFKEINDTLGHDQGDQVLKQIGPRIQGVLRRSDTVARLGGDEFGVLLPTMTNVDQAELTASKILQALQPAFQVGNLELEISASIGIAYAPDHGSNPELLLQRADVAMYLAKRQGIGYAVYAPELDLHSLRQLTLISELRLAIDDGQLVLHYQPKLNFKSQAMTGVEALVRWAHPRHGLIYPDQFIPQVEQTALIKPLTLWVIERALQQHVAWRRLGHVISVAVNLSARNLQDLSLSQQIAALLHQYQVSPDLLTLEITESAIMHDPARALEVLTQIGHMGIQLSIDDFGTGYSSLTYLQKLPVNTVKIDKSFVLEMSTHADSAVIVRSTIDLAHNLGISVIAEGIETRQTWLALLALDCDTAQGYYTGRPIPGEDLIAWLQTERDRD
ncbi:MAG: EAL domain-containing protein [Gammaproteobacteria bacterium]